MKKQRCPETGFTKISEDTIRSIGGFLSPKDCNSLLQLSQHSYGSFKKDYVVESCRLGYMFRAGDVALLKTGCRGFNTSRLLPKNVVFVTHDTKSEKKRLMLKR
eukprot:UN03090